MKQFRLSTMLLLVVVAALCTALVVQQRRAAQREAELQARLAEADARIADELALVAKVQTAIEQVNMTTTHPDPLLEGSDRSHQSDSTEK
jgi:hypothetical protein